MRCFLLFLITICSVFAQPTPKVDTVTILAVGDIMVTSKGTRVLDSAGVSYGLDSLRKELATADVRFANQESPIGTIQTDRFDKKFTFLTPPRHAEVLVDGNFDVVSLANNHGMDYGMPAMKETFAWLESKGIKWAGAGLNLQDSRTPAIIERNGITYGFLAYSNTYPEEFWSTPSRGGNPFGHASYLEKDIPALRNRVDYLFVSFHWGSEKMTATKQYQKDLARLAIDLGADGVFAHHPHVLQGFEYYKEKPIAYSLGNFLFASWSNSVWDSAILKVSFAQGTFLGAEIVPILVNNFKVELQPRILRGADATKSLEALAKLSSVWGTEIRVENDRGYFGPVASLAETGSVADTISENTLVTLDSAVSKEIAGDSSQEIVTVEDSLSFDSAVAQETVVDTLNRNPDEAIVPVTLIETPVQEPHVAPEMATPEVSETPVEESRKERRRRKREK